MGIALLVLIVVAGVIVGLVQARHSSVFAVREIRVSGLSEVSTATVLSLADVPAGTTLFEVDGAAIAKRVESDPWVAAAVVSRDFPHTLAIRVIERKPAAWARVSKKVTWLVANDGTWLRARSKNDTLPVPVVTEVEGLTPHAGTPVGSPELGNALAVLRGLSPELKATVRFVSAPSVEETALVTKSGVQIFVGAATEMEKKDAVVRAILVQQKGKLVYINVRTPDRPTWRGLDQP